MGGFFMHISKYFLLGGLFFVSANANAVSIYDNSISAANINMLTVELIKNAHHGESLSDFIKRKNLYGTMTRFDEYGDDGSTLDTISKSDYSDSLVQDIWIDGGYINTKANYASALNKERSRFYLATAGFDSLDFDLPTGTIMFGGFFGYINGNAAGFDSKGYTIGLFTRYNYQNLSISAMLDNGALKNDSGVYNFNNDWWNVAVEASWKIRLEKTLYLEPELYFGYNYVKADDQVRIYGDTVSVKNFNFWNISPSIKLVKQISNKWYIGGFAKYINTSGGNGDIVFQGTKYNGIKIKDYTETGINLEYDCDPFVFELNAKKQFGKFDGWLGNINIKYLF